LHQVGYLYELNVKLRCPKVKVVLVTVQITQLSHTWSLVCTRLRDLSFQLMADSV